MTYIENVNFFCLQNIKREVSNDTNIQANRCIFKPMKSAVENNRCVIIGINKKSIFKNSGLVAYLLDVFILIIQYPHL